MYTLAGVRGASYATSRNKPNPELMFLIHNKKGFGIPAGCERVWLTDKNGKLEVLSC